VLRRQQRPAQLLPEPRPARAQIPPARPLLPEAWAQVLQATRPPRLPPPACLALAFRRAIHPLGHRRLPLLHNCERSSLRTAVDRLGSRFTLRRGCKAGFRAGLGVLIDRNRARRRAAAGGVVSGNSVEPFPPPSIRTCHARPARAEWTRNKDKHQSKASCRDSG
jgi:hypothetical protein